MPKYYDGEKEIKMRKASALLKERLTQKTLMNGKKNVDNSFLKMFSMASEGKGTKGMGSKYMGTKFGESKGGSYKSKYGFAKKMDK